MAYSKIIHTKSEVVGVAPTRDSLSFGEIAINYSDGFMYIKKADGDIHKVAAADHDGKIAGLLTDVLELDERITYVNNRFTESALAIFGRGNVNTDPDTVVLGIGNTIEAGGEDGTVVGKTNISSGLESFIFGNENTVSAPKGIAIGWRSGVSEANGIAIGKEAKVAAANAIQLGEGTNNTSDTIQFKGSGPVTATQFGYLKSTLSQIGGLDSLVDGTLIVANGSSWTAVSQLELPVSTATQTAINTAITNLVDTAPDALDTLNELAEALGDDPDFFTTTADSIALKASQADFDAFATNPASNSNFNDTNWKASLNLSTFDDDGSGSSINDTLIQIGDLAGVGNESFIMLDDSSSRISLSCTELTSERLAYVNNNSILNAGLNDARYAPNGITEYPYTTDFQSDVEQTRNLTTIDTSSGYFDNVDLSSIYVGSNVTSISGGSFYDSENLVSVTISNSVLSIGGSAFQNCSSLENIVIPNKVVDITAALFSGCSSLTGVSIPNSVTQIDDFAFTGCSILPSITFPNNLNSIGWASFKNCIALGSITIPSSVTSIARQAFEDCSTLTSLTILDSSTSITIGEGAFRRCSDLANVTIGDGLTSIGDGAFQDCVDLASITIPDSVTSIGSFSFAGCDLLVNATLPTNAGFTTIGPSAFRHCDILQSITIPDNVTTIEASAFMACDLTSVTIPANIAEIGDEAFAANYNLATVNCLATTAPATVGNDVFQNTGATDIHVPTGATGYGNEGDIFAGLSVVFDPNL